MIGNLAKLAALAAALLGLSQCDDKPGPLWASLNYTVCAGRQTVCGAGDCCATDDPIQASSDGQELDITCILRPGDATAHQLEFSITGNFDVDGRVGEHGVGGAGILFTPGSAEVSRVRGCDEFYVVYDSNRHPADSCTTTATNEFDAGGCEVQLQSTEDNVVTGTFECKEIQLPGQPRFVSTVQGSTVSFGAFQIRNCINRLGLGK